MVRIIMFCALLICSSVKSEAMAQSHSELNSMNLFLEEITECMAFYNIQYNIRMKEQNFVSARKALLYHQNLSMLAAGLAREVDSFPLLPQLHRSKLEQILEEMQNLYSKFGLIEKKYEPPCLELSKNYEMRRKYWLSRVTSQMY